jgi:protein-tyrosine phosphatase
VSAEWEVGNGPLEVLVVCTGNVCRSPLAARMLQAGFDDLAAGAVRVVSAGIRALDGRPVTPEIARLAARLGVDTSGFRAHTLTPAEIRRADLVLGLDRGHRAAVVATVPQALGRTFTLRELARLLPLVPAEHRAQLPERWRSAAVLASRRRRPVAGDPACDDVVDPYLQDEAVHRTMAGQLVPAVDALLQWERRAAVSGGRR